MEKILEGMVVVILFFGKLYMLGALIYCVATNQDPMNIIAASITMGVCHYMLQGGNDGKKA